MMPRMITHSVHASLFLCLLFLADVPHRSG